MLILPAIPAPPSTVNAPLVLEVEGNVDPILTLPPIPAPPTTVNAPVIGEVEDVFDPMLIFPPIPAPPLTTNAPLLEEVENVSLVITKRLLRVIQDPVKVVMVLEGIDVFNDGFTVQLPFILYTLKKHCIE